MDYKLPSSRKGITPVIAIILLLMMTVAIAGGAYVWFTQIGEQSRERAEESLNRGVEIVELRCDATNDQIITTLKNSGDSELDLNPVMVRPDRSVCVDAFIRTR